jgi:dTDP-4-dehydrorhamnose reductase
MRTVIFGAQGQLGRDLAGVFRRVGEVLSCSRQEANVTDDTSLYPHVERFGPGLIVNASAWNDVDGAEDNLQAAFLANETGPRNVADIALYHQIPVMHFSTDFVFDGQRDTPYPVDAPTCPLGVYGQSKAAGEVAVRRANPRHFIVRTAWLYGPGGNNFVEKILQRAKQQPVLRVVDDEIGSPTYTLDVAEAAQRIAQTHAFGTYHVVNAGACSRYELAREIVRLAGVDVAVEPCKAAEFPTKAQRPAYSVLSNDALIAVTGYTPRPWQDALASYMKRRETSAV